MRQGHSSETAVTRRHPLTIDIVEDEPAVLRSMVRVLSGMGHEIHGYTSSEEFLSNMDADADGCIVMDLCLPGMTGLELQQQLLKRGHARPIVFVTGRADVADSVRAMRAGACNFLLKPVEAEALVTSVQEALQRSERERRKRIRREIVQVRLASLTPRERQVYQGVVAGLMNKQIAARLGVGEKTIKVHRGRVMHKMGAQTVAQLVRMAELMHSTAEGEDEDENALPIQLNSHRSFS